MLKPILLAALTFPGLTLASHGPDLTLESVENRATVHIAWVSPLHNPQLAGTCELPQLDVFIAGFEDQDAAAPQIFACAVPDQ